MTEGSRLTALSLKQVTLCCVDCTPRLPWALKALQRCQSQLEFGDVILCTDPVSLQGHVVPTGVRWVEIEPLCSIEAYSTFMLKSLVNHITTSHVLVVQWDGFVLDASAWRAEFLEFDYIGAPWHHLSGPWTVGNGGFSLRSRRLLNALQDPVLIVEHPEDVCICITHRARLEAGGLRFAPSALAARFSVEDGRVSPGLFGFHGAQHLPVVLEPGETLKFVESLLPSATASHFFGGLLRELVNGARARPALAPALAALQRLIDQSIEQLRGSASLTPQALGLCKELIRYAQGDAAARLLNHRRVALGRRYPETRLWLRLKLNLLTARWR